MVMHRGEIWWASLGEPEGSGPGYRRPVLIVQSDEFNCSRISTVIVAVLTTNFAIFGIRYISIAFTRGIRTERIGSHGSDKPRPPGGSLPS